MPTYIMLSHLTDEGRKTLQERPERLREVNKEVEGMGARLLRNAGLGGFDFVNVIEASGNDAMMHLNGTGSRGTIHRNDGGVGHGRLSTR
jgi:uncharacterized protein with GYD domain